MNEDLNTGDLISAGLEAEANEADALNQQGIKTGQMSTWLRIGSVLASLGGAIARLVKRK